MMADLIVYIEPCYGGSHKQLVDLLQREFGGTIYSLPDTKWHWHMRTSGLYFSQIIPQEHQYKVLFASSVLNLCELLALRSDLKGTHKILYFHENQLIYPVRRQQERDYQYGYNQILSCLVADEIIFNSKYNMRTFLTNIDGYLKLAPDLKLPHSIADQILPKCRVVYFPLQIPTEHYYSIPQTLTTEHHYSIPPTNETLTTEHHYSIPPTIEALTTELSPSCNISDSIEAESTVDQLRDTNTKSTNCLHIVWPHRWEHDKGPEELCYILQKLLDNQLEFCISILGSHTNDIPECFTNIFTSLGSKLLHCGPVTKDIYWTILATADVVLSTAKHEFYGVAMLEATCCGCYPLCPNTLVYPEIYPIECLYNTEQQLFKKLKNMCLRPYLAKHYRNKMSFDASIYQWTILQKPYKEMLRVENNFF